MAAALLLPARTLLADDTPEEARQKAIKKAQEALIAAAKQGDAEVRSLQEIHAGQVRAAGAR